MENYNKVKQFCEYTGCQLLTTFEEFEIQRSDVLKKSFHYVRINFIGVCGHKTSAVVTNFMKRKTGINCKDCVRNNVSNAKKNKINNSSEIEYLGIKILEDYLKDKYEVIRTNEGCRADLAIRKLNMNNNLYIGIQIKTTLSKVHNMYTFRCLNKNYDNMLIICICIVDEKIWVIPYNELNLKSNLNISVKSKYNKYYIQNNLFLSDHLDTFIDLYCNNTINNLNIPISKYQKREQEYIQKRETYINFLQYLKQNIQNTQTDFIVNGKKVQEKVCGYKENKNGKFLIAHLSSNNGKYDNGMKKYRTYCLGENDYYWFHSSIDDRFWIIPELIMFENNLISDNNCINPKKIINLELNIFDKYRHNYKNYNKDDIMKIFT